MSLSSMSAPRVLALHAAQSVVVVEHADALAETAPHEMHDVLLQPATKGGDVQGDRTDNERPENDVAHSNLHILALRESK